MPILAITGDHLPETPPDNYQSFAPESALFFVTWAEGDDFDCPDTLLLPMSCTIGIRQRYAAAGPAAYMPFLCHIRRRYQNGDYGLTAGRHPEDAAQNQQALADRHGLILAVYLDPDGQEIWIAQVLPGEPIPVCLLPEEW